LSYAHDYELSNMTTINERIITAELRPKDSQQHDIDKHTYHSHIRPSTEKQ
jgi:hypothetical protein